MTESPRLPVAARALITVVSVAGIAALAGWLARADGFGARTLLTIALVAAAVIVADRFTFEIPHGDDDEHFALTDGVWVAAIVLAAPGVATLGAALGTAIWQGAARWAPRKVAFNVSQVAVALTAAEAIFSLAPGDRSPASPATWAFAAFAMAICWVLNTGAVALVIALAQQASFRRVFFDPWRLNVIQWLGNVSLGLLAALVWHVSPVGLILLALPCALLSLAYRAWVRSTIERNQMEEMMRAAETIARERTFHARLPVGERTGRLPALALALNHMLEQLEHAYRRQRQVMGDVAAELRGPIASIYQSVAEDAIGTSTPSAGGVRRRIGRDLDRISRTLDDMADIGRSQQPDFVRREPVRVADVVADISAKAAPFLGERLRTAAPPPHSLAALDRERIEKALLGLLKNTADHASGSRPVDFRAVDEDRTVLFEVVDEGGGVPAGLEDAIFEPFYRADANRSGPGLGLALVRTVAEAHGGSAGVVNRPGAGVTFWLRVPR